MRAVSLLGGAASNIWGSLSPADPNLNLFSYCKRYVDYVEVQQEQASVYVVLDDLLK